MYELSRVRLHSVGPKGARYQDVTLDLRDVGAPVAGAAQGSLLEPSAATRRPSPASVLFTENGSGKSVLMKLIFSVMLPGRRQVVGTSSSRVLENFVLDTDVAQVALEWQHTLTGERVVTGKVAAWRGHVVSADPTRLTEAWYSFHPSPASTLDGEGFTLDSLPLTENARLVSLSGFRERLTEAGRSNPALQVVWETNHGAWTEHLESLELDPTLFVYQRRMNAGEGEAADAFSFASDEAFVDWLLRSVVDEEDPRDLAEVLDGYSSILARRETLSVEKTFVSGALERLGVLATVASSQRAATEQLASTERSLAAFAAGVSRRHAEDAERLVSLDERSSSLAESRSAASDSVARLDSVVAELQRRVAGLRLQQATAVREAVTLERSSARAHLAAWQATGVLLRARQAKQAADSLRTFVGQKEGDAAPILAERDAAARRLAAGLAELAALADRLAADTVSAAAALDARIAELGNEERENALLAERRRNQAESIRGRIATASSAAASAVDDGLLEPGADASTTADRAVSEALEAERVVREAEEEQPKLARRRTSAASSASGSEQAARSHEHEVRTLSEQYDRVLRATDAIAGQPRAAALLGAQTVHADTDAPALLTRLGEAVAEAEAERTGLQLALATDRKVLSALGTGGLLPPPEDVSAACAVLRDAGLACYAGWEYLARLPEDARDSALQRYPHLIDGVVLTNASVLPKARQLLTDARLLPGSIVAVGLTSTLSSGAGDRAPGLEFVVPPNPAMYDEALAEAEREALLTRQGEREARMRELETQIAADRRLGDRVEEWLREYPPGTLARLEDGLSTARSASAVAAEQAEVVRSLVDDLLAEEQELADRLPELRRSAAWTRRRADRLAAVAAESVQIPAWTREVHEALENATLADNTARACLDEAQRLRGSKEETVRRGDDQRRIAYGGREEIAQIPGVSAPFDPAPEGIPVQTLRVAYRSAAEAYANVEVGQDLRAQLDSAERAEADARSSLEALRPADRSGAAAHLDTPDGSDGPGRSAATERAERALAQLDERVGAADGEVGRLRAAFEALPERSAAVEEFSTMAEGEELATSAATAREGARRRLEEIERQVSGLEEQLFVVRGSQDGFSDLLESIDASPDSSEADAFAGPLAAARERVRELRSAHAAARSRVSETATEVRRCSSALHKYAANQDFERAQSPVRQQILAIEVDVLPTHAAEWEAALRPRLRTLTDDLENIGRHRSQITTRLRGMVTTALTVLQAAERVSVLPETLGDWAGQKFLRIRFADPDRSSLDERLGEVIDEFAAADAKGRRDGMSLLLRGVRAAMPKGVRVEMLKPDASERAERVRIAQVSDVFSGGQLLTAAIILYCTMAALRANERGQTRRPHAGVLFLDNPIGRASAGYLLELQLGVADALGVQLIYTTGLFDVNALSVFPLIVRLRNDRDLRSGMRFLIVEDEIKQRLDALGTPDGTGQLTAARLFRKPVLQA